MKKHGKLKKIIIIAAILTAVFGAAAFVRGSRLHALNIQKIADYMYSMECRSYSYDLAEEIINYGVVEPGCSAVRNGSIAGRNFDWYLDEDAEFVITTPGGDGRYASLGVAALTGLTDEFVGSGKYSLLYEFMPFYTVDGINEKGLFVSVNVVPAGDAGITTGTNPDGEDMPNVIIARYILDYAASVEEAVQLLSEKNIYAYEDADGPFELHLMVCDREKSIAVEFIDNQMVVCDTCDIMTNFYMGLADYTEHAMGIERYDILKTNYEGSDTVEGMLKLLKMVEYSQYYDADTQPRWYSEAYGEVYTDDGDIFGLSSDVSNFDPVFLAESKAYGSAERDGTFWETTHCSVYDLDNLTLSMYVQEGDTLYTASLDTDALSESAEEDGTSARKVIMAMELVCLTTMITVLLGMIFENTLKDRKSTVFVHVVIAAIIGLCADLVAWNYDGMASKVLAQTISNYLGLIMSEIIAVVFILYEYEFIKDREKKGFGFVLAAIVLNAAGILLMTIGIPLEKTFHFVGGLYFVDSWYFISYVLAFINMIIVVAMTLNSRKILGPHDTVAFLIYVLVPLCTTVISVFMPELELAYVSIAIAIPMIYIMLQSGKVDELQVRQHLLEEISYTDALTGLFNRRAYDGALAKGVVSNTGVLFCDINGLKYTNDNLGHKAGDDLITDFSAMLTDFFGHDCVFRISGDEFTVIWADVESRTFSRRVEEFRIAVKEKNEIAAVGSRYVLQGDLLESLRTAEKDMYGDKAAFYEKNPERDRREK